MFAADFVTTEDGTGLVHSAGAFGEDDKVVTDREGIVAVMPVGPDGRFTEPVHEYAGLQVFDANLPIIDDLKAVTRGEVGGSVTPGTVLLRHEIYAHPYPHCWRCKKPLIYKGGLQLVRRGHQDQGPDGRAQPADQLGARARQGRPVRQVAGQRP